MFDKFFKKLNQKIWDWEHRKPYVPVPHDQFFNKGEPEIKPNYPKPDLSHQYEYLMDERSGQDPDASHWVTAQMGDKHYWASLDHLEGVSCSCGSVLLRVNDSWPEFARKMVEWKREHKIKLDKPSGKC